jgi:hypothetical protein
MVAVHFAFLPSVYWLDRPSIQLAIWRKNEAKKDRGGATEAKKMANQSSLNWKSCTKVSCNCDLNEREKRDENQVELQLPLLPVIQQKCWFGFYYLLINKLKNYVQIDP